MALPTLQDDPRRAEYASRFNRVLDHIEAHLGEPLDLETLAAVACFSPFHFHRLFHGWMGETLHDFILRLRLERAASMLIHAAGRSVTEIGLDCGFSSPSAFARAFKAFHGVSASRWRQDRKNRQAIRKDRQADDGTGPASWNPAGGSGHLLESVMGLSLKVDVKRLPPLPVAYLRHVGPYQNRPGLFQELFGRLCAWAGPRGLLGPDSRFLSVYYDNPEITEPDRLRLDVAVTVPGDTPAAGEIGRQVLPGGLYAVTRVRIRPDQYGQVWDELMGGWFPTSGFQPDDRPCFEIALNDPGRDPEGMHEVEICEPVREL